MTVASLEQMSSDCGGGLQADMNGPRKELLRFTIVAPKAYNEKGLDLVLT